MASLWSIKGRGGGILGARFFPGLFQSPGLEDGVIHVCCMLVRQEGDIEGPKQL